MFERLPSVATIRLSVQAVQVFVFGVQLPGLLSRNLTPTRFHACRFLWMALLFCVDGMNFRFKFGISVQRNLLVQCLHHPLGSYLFRTLQRKGYSLWVEWMELSRYGTWTKHSGHRFSNRPPLSQRMLLSPPLTASWPTQGLLITVLSSLT